MPNNLLEIWGVRHMDLLDVGSCTGPIAQAIADLFPVENLEASVISSGS